MMKRGWKGSMKTQAFTIEQIDLMKHAIGLDDSKPKRGRYSAYRNYFITVKKEEPWERLVERGYAASQEDYRNGQYYVCYSVTRKGMNILERIMEIIIREDK